MKSEQLIQTGIWGAADIRDNRPCPDLFPTDAALFAFFQGIRLPPRRYLPTETPHDTYTIPLMLPIDADVQL